MSWSVSTTLEGFEYTDEGLQKAHELLRELVPTGSDNAPEERDEQLLAAKNTAYNIIKYGGFENAETILVLLSGHANIDHKKDSEWSNEFIHIEVYVKSYKDE